MRPAVRIQLQWFSTYWEYQKKWNNRIVVAVVSCIGAVLGSATLTLILGYYQ